MQTYFHVCVSSCLDTSSLSRVSLSVSLTWCQRPAKELHGSDPDIIYDDLVHTLSRFPIQYLHLLICAQVQVWIVLGGSRGTDFTNTYTEGFAYMQTGRKT